MKRIPRKKKKMMKQIPVGNYCYGSYIGIKRKLVNGVKGFKGGCCPFHHSTKNPKIAFCSFLHKHDDFLLADQTKICGEAENYFDLKTGKFTKNIDRVFQ